MNFDVAVYAWARALHVLGVVVWIGGVFFVTAVLLPALKRFPAQERLPLFSALEHRFSWIARVALLVVVVSGVFLAHMIGFWERMGESHLWPIHLMMLVSVIFSLILFVIESILGKRVLEPFARRHPEKAFARAGVIHWLLTLLSFAAVLAGVLLAHGYILFA